MIKKTFLLLTILSSFTLGNLMAQDIQFGLKPGFQITNFNGEGAKKLERDARVAFNVGFFANRRVNDFSFQTELLYSVKGINVEDRNDRLRLTYIELPIIAKYYFHEKFNVHLGPQLGFLIHAGYADVDVNDQFNGLDLGAIAGFEFDPKQNFHLGIRYNLGIISVADDFEPYNDGTIISDLKNRAFQFYLGFNFGAAPAEGS